MPCAVDAPSVCCRATYRRKKSSHVHIAVDTLENLLVVKVTTANEQEWAQVAELVAQVQEVTGGNVEVAFAD